MLIPLSSLCDKYNPRITGIIHVGAHWAEEHADYLRAGVNKVAYIEAAKAAFYRLQRVNLSGEVSLHNVALADYEGETQMYIETSNQGQSSSLLKPGTHLQHYPGITFPQRETVRVTTLDKLGLKGYNMLNLDVQGAELMVLKGGTQTLQGVEYIYTEVNKEPVYEGCALIEDMDAFLIPLGFTRAETTWTGQGWGDAFYVRTGGRHTQSVPRMFQPKMPFPYPSDNHYEFERWFHDNLTPAETRERVYLPVFWTAYYINAKYGKDKMKMAQLQEYVKSLDRSKKYFTIVQYDDGILTHLPEDLDIKVFSMGGGRIDYPLPLICQPHPRLPMVHKDIFCSFVGQVTHPIRQQMIDELKGKPGFYIETKPRSIKQFTEILNRSQFVLCPRGYGKTSFRIQEALQYGATPVYLAPEGDHIIPHGIKETCIVATSASHVLSFANWELERTPQQNRELFYQYFTYESNKKLILQNI